MDKTYISAQQLLEASFKLAHEVYRDGFRPDFIVGVWRGGTTVGIAVQEYFEYKGISTDHTAIRTSSYYGIGQQTKQIRIYGLHYLREQIAEVDRLLIVDDVFDSGRSLEALIGEIRHQAGKQMPSDIRIACPWYKPSMTKVNLAPDYYVHENDDWLVFPHELCGLQREEIEQGKQDLKEIVDLF